MRLSIILLLVSLRCQTAYHIQFYPSNSSTTYIPFTPRHHNSASFVTARQHYGCVSYIPLPYFLTVSRKRPFQNPIHNGFFLMLMLLSGDIHVILVMVFAMLQRTMSPAISVDSKLFKEGKNWDKGHERLLSASADCG